MWIYDLNADKWYFQETTGAIPAERMSACAVGVTAPDKKSHQIFYYGGSSPTPMFGLNVDEVNKKNTFGDLYVLSLPTFKWLKLEKLDDVPLSRSRHNCHVINNRQMLIVGGGRDQSKDLQEYFRTTCRWDEISVLDMSALRWETQYTPAKTPYTVSTEVAQDSMDSSGQPGTAPSVGWATSELKELFSPSANVSGPTPDTTAPQPPKSSKATIIGAAVGGSVGVLLVAAAIIAFLWKRKRDKKIASMVEPTAGSVQQTETAAPISRQSPPPGYWDPRTRSFISTTGTWYLHAASGSPVSPQFADIHEVIGDDIGPEPVEAVEADSKPVLHELPSP